MRFLNVGLGRSETSRATVSYEIGLVLMQCYFFLIWGPENSASNEPTRVSPQLLNMTTHGRLGM